MSNPKYKIITNKSKFLIREMISIIILIIRDLDKFLTHYEKGAPVYLYTGRGPSTDAMHLGHLLPFLFTKWMQDAFKCPLVIQISDDEKYFYQKTDKKIKNLDYFREIGIENCKDILALGFDPELTFIFRNTDYIGHMYHNVVEFQRHITYNQIKGNFKLIYF